MKMICPFGHKSYVLQTVSLFFFFFHKISLYLRLCQPNLKANKMIRAISNAVLS